MISKSTISFIRSLHQKKFRLQHQLFIVEGEKMVDDLLVSDFIIHSLYANEKWEERHMKSNSKDLLTLVNDKVLEQLSALKTANQVIAVVHQPDYTFNEIFEEKNYLVLDGINDPGNMGTIIRIADWFGIQEIFISNDCVDPFNPKVVQATMGSLFRVKVYESDLKELFSMNSEKYKLPVLGAILNGKNIYSELLPAKGLLVIGNESRGVNTDYHKYFTHSISIPSFNRNQQAAESLNAAVATGIICSEWNRHQSL